MTDKPNGIEFGEMALLPDERTEPVPGRETASPPNRDALISDLEALVSHMGSLPSRACPEDLVTVLLTLRRDSSAWRSRCRELFGSLELTFIGSRHLTRHVDRRFDGTRAAARSAIAVVAVGSKSRLGEAAERAKRLDAPALERLSVVDSIRLAEPRDRIRTTGSSETGDFEAALRLMPGRDDRFPYIPFKDYAAGLGFRIHEHHLYEMDGLLYVLLDGPRNQIPALAEFTFLRQVTEAPKLRSVKPPIRATDDDVAPLGDGDSAAGRIVLPAPASPPPDFEVIIMDGGIPADNPVKPWLKEIVLADPAQDDCDGYAEHGLAVTSANLFGPMSATGRIQPPRSVVTFCRVLDKGTDKDDPLTMTRALRRVERYAKKDAFINISFGPSLSTSDDVVSAWTSRLDNLARTLNAFITVAAGNNGESVADVAPGSSATTRIQVPADAINVIGVGALDTTGPDWRRAPYSAEGPGRRPTVVKPDLSAFGGSEREPFLVLAPGAEPRLRQEMGTSFAAPCVSRQAIGLRALCGPKLSMLGVKALLVHYAERRGQNMLEVGWGRVPEADEAFSGRSGESRLVYQGSLPPNRFYAVRLREPEGGWKGKKRILATFCFNAVVSLHDPAAYGETALEAVFFRDMDAGLAGSSPPVPFFDLDGDEVNRDVDYREVNMDTVKKNYKDFDGADLVAPGFVIRAADQNDQTRQPIDISLVVSVTSSPD
jgi:hypothetical protein